MESVLFITLAIFGAATLLYLNYRNHRCVKCNQKLKSKRYLWLDPWQNRMVPICQECFYDVVTKSDPEEEIAN